jgi:ribose 5-phosphate isomerase B
MKIAVGSDEVNAVTQSVMADLVSRGHQVTPFGPLAGQVENWAVVAGNVGQAVTSGEVDEGVLFCWTGTGVSIAANKIPGVRAALCSDAETARGARLWNNANVLCLSLRLTSQALAQEILDVWFSTKYEPNPQDDACLSQLVEIERVARDTDPPN